MGGIEAAAPPAASVDTRLSRIESFTQETVRVILRNSPGCSWVDSSGGYARVDGLLVSNRGELLALYEIKCRNVSVADLFGKFDAELMVDAGKLNSMQSISRMMCARSYLVSYLTPNGVVLQTQITNDSGELVCQNRIESTTAPAGMGRGLVEKEAAYIRLDGTTKILSTKEDERKV